MNAQVKAILAIAVVFWLEWSCVRCVADEAEKLLQLDADLRSNPTDVDRRSRRSEISVRALETFESADDSKLMQLFLAESDCISCLAAWRLADSDKKAESRGTAWFIGYLEGRHRIDAPSFWQNELQRVRRDEGEKREFPEVICSDKIREEGHSVILGKLTLFHSQSDHIEVKDGRLLFRRKGFECQVDGSELAFLGAGKAQICFAIDANNLAVALIEDTGSMYPVLVFSTKDGKLKWKNTIWGNLTGESGQFRFARFRHCMSLECDNNMLRVFGTSGPAYCEFYDISTGKCRLRFSTSCWYAASYRKITQGLDKND